MTGEWIDVWYNKLTFYTCIIAQFALLDLNHLILKSDA
jgi:hypothetical protein